MEWYLEKRNIFSITNESRVIWMLVISILWLQPMYKWIYSIFGCLDVHDGDVPCDYYTWSCLIANYYI